MLIRKKNFKLNSKKWKDIGKQTQKVFKCIQWDKGEWKEQGSERGEKEGEKGIVQELEAQKWEKDKKGET